MKKNLLMLITAVGFLTLGWTAEKEQPQFIKSKGNQEIINKVLKNGFADEKDFPDGKERSYVTIYEEGNAVELAEIKSFFTVVDSVLTISKSINTNNDGLVTDSIQLSTSLWEFEHSVMEMIDETGNSVLEENYRTPSLAIIENRNSINQSLERNCVSRITKCKNNLPEKGDVDQLYKDINKTPLKDLDYRCEAYAVIKKGKEYKTCGIYSYSKSGFAKVMNDAQIEMEKNNKSSDLLKYLGF